MPSTPPEAAAARCRIEIDKLRKEFLANDREVVAVDDASFRINDGEFVALLGPSGCGKSTILNMVATLIAPTGGAIRVDGAPVTFGKPVRHVGYVFQKDTLFPWRTVEDNIGYSLELAGVPAARAPEARRRGDPPGRSRRLPRITVAVGRHAHYPGGPDRGCRDLLRAVRPSPILAVDIRNCTFEACSGFTRE